MTQHYSFINDAANCFGEAFKLYEAQATKSEGECTLAPLAACCRLLYIALEKGFKDSLEKIDPHLLLAKPDRKLLLDLRHDILNRPVPTIFCSRQQFETLNLDQSWEALKLLLAVRLDEQVARDFDQSLKKLIKLRHRAQHGEWFEEPQFVLAVVRQVLARFHPVMSSLAPVFWTRLAADNGQLKSRLKAIELGVDSSWQVLIDYLRNHGNLRMEIDFFANLSADGEQLSVLFGDDNRNYMLGRADIPLTMADGLFTSRLTKTQASDRYSERMRRMTEAGIDGIKTLPDGVEGLPTLETGHLSISLTSAWLSLFLESIKPSQLYVSANLSRLQITFSNPDSAQGEVHGLLQCAVIKLGENPESIFIDGDAFFSSEFYSERASPQEDVSSDVIQRSLRLALTLSLKQPSLQAFQQPNTEDGIHG